MPMHSVSGCFCHMHHCGRCRIPASRRAYWVAKLAGNAARDLRSRRTLRRLGWRVLVIWECQIETAEVEALRTRFVLAGVAG